MTTAVEAKQQIRGYVSAAPGYATHEVLNQAGALANYNAYTDDKPLVEAVKVFGADWASETLRRTGTHVGSEKVQYLARVAITTARQGASGKTVNRMLHNSRSIRSGELAKSNAEQVSLIRGVLESLGFEIATLEAWVATRSAFHNGVPHDPPRHPYLRRLVARFGRHRTQGEPISIQLPSAYFERSEQESVTL
jgi:Adaptive response protein AidB N-terminal domain